MHTIVAADTFGTIRRFVRRNMKLAHLFAFFALHAFGAVNRQPVYADRIKNPEQSSQRTQKSAKRTIQHNRERNHNERNKKLIRKKHSRRGAQRLVNRHQGQRRKERSGRTDIFTKIRIGKSELIF